MTDGCHGDLCGRGITVVGNIPLNNRLDGFDLDGGTDEEVTAARRDYEGPWNRLHYTRSALGVLVVALTGASALAGED